MMYEGNDGKVNWTGEVAVVQDNMCVMVENDEGTPVLALGAGKLIPENWIGKRVKVLIELVPLKNSELN